MLFIFIFIIITSCSSLYPINDDDIELFKLNKHCELRPYHPKFLLIFLMMKLVLSKKNIFSWDNLLSKKFGTKLLGYIGEYFLLKFISRPNNTCIVGTI